MKPKFYSTAFLMLMSWLALETTVRAEETQVSCAEVTINGTSDLNGKLEKLFYPCGIPPNYQPSWRSVEVGLPYPTQPNTRFILRSQKSQKPLATKDGVVGNVTINCVDGPSGPQCE